MSKELLQESLTGRLSVFASVKTFQHVVMTVQYRAFSENKFNALRNIYHFCNYYLEILLLLFLQLSLNNYNFKSL